jgi:small subunit ribosomal protein S8
MRGFANDPIADMLTRIRNANQMRYKEVEVPASKIKIEIARILKEEGFIADYKIKKNDVQSIIVLFLKYGDKKERVITGLKRISKPGLRVYAKAQELPRVLNGLGIAIVSTSHGVMTDKDARNQSLGGEVLAYIW